MPRRSNTVKIPRADAAERAVVGACLASPEAAVEASGAVTPSHFYGSREAAAFKGVVSCVSRGIPPDLVTVAGELRRLGLLDEAGGVSALSAAADDLPDPANVGHYAQLVLDASIRRQALALATRMMEEASSGDGTADELIDRSVGGLLSLKHTPSAAQELSDIISDRLSRIDGGEQDIMIPSIGFEKLDYMIGGLEPGQLFTVGALTSVGKTSFALDITRHAVLSLDKSVLVVSIEMSRDQIGRRIACQMTGVPPRRQRSGRIDQYEREQIESVRARFRGKRLMVVDDIRSLAAVRAVATKRKFDRGLDMVVVDYVQLMEPPKKVNSREQEVTVLSRGLKALAKDLGVPVIMLAQLNREASKVQQGRSDENRWPKLSHFRESGAIEQDSDLVVLLHREVLQTEETNYAVDAVGILAKQRQGPTGVQKMLYDRQLASFRQAYE